MRSGLVRCGLWLATASVALAACSGDGSAVLPNGPVARRITVVGQGFDWIPSTIEVEVGQTVELTLESRDVPHGLSCRQLGIPPTDFTKERPATVVFTAGRPGRYPFKCSKYCGRDHRRMRGEIVVVPARGGR